MFVWMLYQVYEAYWVKVIEVCVKDMGEYRDVTIDGLYMEDILRVVQDHRFVLQTEKSSWSEWIGKTHIWTTLPEGGSPG